MSVLSFQNRPGYSLHASAGLQGAGAYLYRTEYHCEAAGAVAGQPGGPWLLAAVGKTRQV